MSSSSVTSPVPSDSEGWLVSSDVIPKRRAAFQTLSRPMSSATLTAVELIERATASRSDTLP